MIMLTQALLMRKKSQSWDCAKQDKKLSKSRHIASSYTHLLLASSSDIHCTHFAVALSSSVFPKCAKSTHPMKARLSEASLLM